MKKAIKKFQLIIHNESSENGVLINADRPLKGTVVLELLRPMRIRCIMVGRSKTVHCSEIRFNNTRVGKQIYLESVQTVFGDVDGNEVNFHSSGYHRYPFEITEDSSTDDVMLDKSNRLTWSTIKAVLIDDASHEYFADVFTENNNTDVQGSISRDFSKLGQNVNHNHQQFMSEFNSCNDPKKQRAVNSGRFPGRESIEMYKSHLGSNKNSSKADSRDNSLSTLENCEKTVVNGVSLWCNLKQGFYEPGESVSFICQCGNNTQKGYKNITAFLVEHRKKETRRCSTRLGSKMEPKSATKDTVVGSVIGPAIGPKELVVWESYVATQITEDKNDSWFTLRLEIAVGLLSKVHMEIPVIIMQDPRTPTIVALEQET